MSKDERKQVDRRRPLPSERLVNVDHYDDLIAIRIAAKHVVYKLGNQHKDLPEMQLLEEALNYKHNSCK